MDNTVFLAACDTYEQAEEAVSRCFDAFGGAKAILAGRRKVLVKPNLAMPRNPSEAITTHPAVVYAVCKQFLEAGATVGIIDSNAQPFTQATLKSIYKATEMENAALDSGAELLYDTSVCDIEFPQGVTAKRFRLLSPVTDADLVVTVGKLKTHALTNYTGAVKNLFGCIPGGEKRKIHAQFPDRLDFAEMLVDLNLCINPGFAVLDAVIGMEGAGPTSGSPKKVGAILAGCNPFAVDVAACSLVSIRPEECPHLAAAAKRSLMTIDPKALDWLGDDPSQLATVFIPAISLSMPTTGISGIFILYIYHFLPKFLQKILLRTQVIGAKYPIISNRCIGCGECARVCPKSVIQIESRQARIDYKHCIRCYCCHEFCPYRAIDFSKRPKG